MPILRQSVVDTFDVSLRRAFDASVAATFRDVWPSRVEQLGNGYPQFIHDAIDRVYSHHLTSDRDAARFVNLCLLWGLAFEDAPRHQWTREILDDHEVPAGIRIEHLYERSERELDALSVAQKQAPL
jgi:hypothetical protein